jgi:hypothetical protein
MLRGVERRDVPFATFRAAKNTTLFDHLVGTGLKRLRHDQTKRLGSLEIDNQSNLVGGCPLGRIFSCQSINAIFGTVVDQHPLLYTV